MKRLGRLEVVAFAAGFALMAYELAAARLLAPWIGSSMYVWTSVIGVIVAALSLGYWMGGKLADARHHASDVAWMTLAVALGVVMTRITGDQVLEWVSSNLDDPRWQGLLAAILLFAPASFILGAISPYLAKLNIRTLASAGRSVASLGALNSVGGIVGTFVTGFFMFGYVGATEVLVLVVAILVAASWLLAPRSDTKWRLAISLVLIGLMLLPQRSSPSVIKIDTPSANYQVIEASLNGQPVRGLTTGPGGVQSAVFVDGNEELVFWYTKEMARLTIDRQPSRVLMLGGGAFTLPQHLSEQLPKAQIDVVEIDPDLEKISTKYFNYRQPSNVSLVFDDARSFLNRTTEHYDVVLVDVYGDAEIPFTLMTQQFGQALARVLKPDSLVVVNMIAGLSGGPCQDMFAAFDAAFRQVLPFASYSTEDNRQLLRGNHIIAYSKTEQSFSGMISFGSLNGQLYTDNFAPSERLYFACRQA